MDYYDGVAMKAFFVYVDYTVDHVPFYVGKGNLIRTECLKRNKKHQRVSAKYGCKRLRIIQTCDEKEAFEYEKLLIEKLGTKNGGLNPNRLASNFTDGGEGCGGGTWKLSKETRRRQSLAQKGRKRLPETIERIAASKRGRKLSLEHRQRIGDGNKGRVMPFDVCEKIRNTLKGHTVSPEMRTKISDSVKASQIGKPNPFLGKKHTPESLAKMSAASRQHKTSNETREKLRQATLRRYADPEAKLAHSKTMKKMWADKRSKASRVTPTEATALGLIE
jgi:hypothetical protein